MVCVTRWWAGRENAILPEPASSHTKRLKTRRLPPVGCTLCWVGSHVLAEILKTLPEDRPGHVQIVTHVNGPMIDRFVVLNVERRDNLSNERAVLEVCQEFRIE